MSSTEVVERSIARLALIGTTWLVTLLGGCRSETRIELPFVISDEQFRSFEERLAAHAEILRQSSEAPVPTEIRDRHDSSIGGFRETLARFKREVETISRLGKEDAGFQALEAVKGSLDRCRALRQALIERATEVSLATDEAETHFESLRLRPIEAEPVVGLEKYPQYVTSARRLSEILGDVDAYLASTHLRAVSDSDAPNRGPATTVHCMLLSELPAVDLRPHLDTYHHAWKSWYRQALRGGSLDGALAIYSFIAEQKASLSPESARELLELAQANVEQTPSRDVLDHELSSIRDIESSFQRNGAPSGWEHARDVLRSSVLLCIAKSEVNIEARVDIATRAFEISQEFPNETARVFAQAALERGRAAAAERRLVEAVIQFEATLGKGPGKDLDYHVSRFREEVFAEGIKTLREQIRATRATEADETFEQLRALAKSGEERSLLRGEHHRFVHLALDRFSRTDPDRALAIGRAAEDQYPGDTKLKVKIDQALVERVRREIGDLSRSYQKLGAARIRALVRKAGAATRTAIGMGGCQSLLQEIETHWLRQSALTSSPDDRFQIARASALLVGQTAAQAQTRGAIALLKLVEENRGREDWSGVENAVEAAYRHCPEIQRPAALQEAHRDLIRSRHDSGKRDTLHRHLALYTLTYRRSLRDIDDLLATYVQPESPEGRGLYRVLREVAPRHPVVRRFEERELEIGSSDRPETVEPLAAAELAGVSRWWREPPPLDAVHFDLTKENTAAAADDAGARAALPRVRVAAWGFFSASVLGILAALAATMRVGVLRFEYYAVVSTLFGSTGGFLLGIL